MTADPYISKCTVLWCVYKLPPFLLFVCCSTFHTVDMVVKKLGHMLTDYLPSLLKILLGLTATCVACLENRNQIARPAVNVLKSLRQTATARITQVNVLSAWRTGIRLPGLLSMS